MSFNKFMHPRNRYRKPPDFKALAIKYPEFRKYAKQDISGKVSLNFKDLEAVRELTRTLLQEDFSLDVEIPLDRLIPTLPLRLNYLLWIEDLLECNERKSDVNGIDIGCGASCVYPLLAAKQFGWRMLATEVDVDSAFIASRNVKKNNLQDMITVRTVKEGQMLEGILEPTVTYDFCMCNPPFFSSTDELDPKNMSRSPNRPAPRNAHSGTPTELVVPGGETAFIADIIRDSIELKTVVRIYSVMVGHKTSVGKVRQALQEAGVTPDCIVTSEFHQGRTTRWGVAWTLDPSVSLPKHNHVPHPKKNVPFCHTFESDLVFTVDRLKKLLEELQITYKILKSSEEASAMEITATENNWANSRKKRRQEKLKQKMAEMNQSSKGTNIELKPKENSESNNGNGDGNTEKVTSKQEKAIEECNKVSDSSGPESDHRCVEQRGSKRSPSETDECSSTSDLHPTKKTKLENVAADSNFKTESPKEPIFVGSLVAKKLEKECLVELTWLRGSGGKDSAHQVLQYFKNNFKPR